MPSQGCGSLTGDCSVFCYEGFGLCDGIPYYSANTTFDPQCAAEQGMCFLEGGIWKSLTCTCQYTSPVLIDLTGDGFHLTGAEAGVQFQFNTDGPKVRTAWTATGAEGDAFLVFDRDGNGAIDNGTELFGNFTPQPSSASPNGFTALAVLDTKESGGNEDGKLSASDSMFSQLQLWVDANHDGISQRSELRYLAPSGISSLGIDFRESKRKDQYGNVFRYRAAVNPELIGSASTVGKWAYDVFFTTPNIDGAGKSGSVRSGGCKRPANIPTRSALQAE